MGHLPQKRMGVEAGALSTIPGHANIYRACAHPLPGYGNINRVKAPSTPGYGRSNTFFPFLARLHSLDLTGVEIPSLFMAE